MSASPSSVVGGSTQEATLTVTVDTLENTSVYLSANGVGVQFIYQGQSVTTLPISGGVGSCTVRAPSPVSQNTAGTIYATATNSGSTQFTVTPILNSVSLSPSSIVGGSIEEATGTITFAASALSATSVSLSSTPYGLTFTNMAGQTISNVTVPAGDNSVQFKAYQASALANTVNYTVNANTAGKIVTASLTATPNTFTFSLSPSSIFGNNSDASTGSVQLSASVRSNSSVSLSQSGSGLTFWNGSTQIWSGSIPAGQNSATFSVKAAPVTGIVNYTVYASYITSQNQPLTVYGVGPIEMGPCEQCEAQAGHPINLTNGNVWLTQTDFSLPGLGGGIHVARTWNSLWQNATPVETAGMFGHSWRSTYEERLVSGTPLRYWRADGSVWQFQYDSINQTYGLISPANKVAVIVYDSGTTLYTLTFHDGSQKIFNSGGRLTKVIDRNGNQTSVTYDGSNRITQVTDAANRSVTFTYSGGGARAVSMQDSTGTIATYQYDASARLTKVTYADSSYMDFNYNASNLLLDVKDSQAKVLEAHTYDAYRRGLTSERADGVEKVTIAYVNATTTRVTDSLSNVSDYTHQALNAARRITAFSGSGCFTCGGRGTAAFGFDFKSRPVTTTDALGRETTYTFDIYSNLTSRSVELDAQTTLTWSYTYNSRGQVLTATDPMGNVTTNTYDTNGNLTSTQAPSPDGGTTVGPVTSFTYNSLGLLTGVTDPRNNATTIAYNSAGLISSVTDAQSNVTSYAYDARGNRTSVTDANNKTTTFTYDVMNRLTQITAPSPDGSAPQPVTTFAYDYRGRRTSVTDANSKVTTYAYDDADRLTSVTDAASNVTTYTYDTENNLTKIKDALLRETEFAYDPRGRVTQVTFPSTLYETYIYDAVGNLTSKTDRKNQTIEYSYDALDRLVQKEYPDSSTVSYVYDHNSRLTQVSDATGTYDFAYDDLGRLIATETAYSFLTSRTFTVEYEYDAASNRTQMTDPESGVTAYAHDTLNRLTTLTPPSAFTSGSFGFSYDALSRRTAFTRPNGVNTEYAYDNLSRLLSVLHKLSGNTIDGASYTVDAVGNRTAKANLLPSGPTENYTYDATYQLTQVTKAGPTTTEGYGYDAVGNRLSSLAASPWTYNSSNHLTSIAGSPGTTFTYDNNGNTATKVDSSGTTTYTWDYENRLTQVTLPGSGGTVYFKYDPLGRRIYKSTSADSSIFAYDGENLIEEVDTNGNPIARYTMGLSIDEPLAMLRSSATHFYQPDGLGSITSLSDSAGSLPSTYTYDSFGNLVSSTGSVTNPFRYTSREWDSETDLYYYRARYYDKARGRFLGEDPLRFVGAVTNFFPYVSNNPMTRVDPTGLSEKDVQKIKAAYVKVLEKMNQEGLRLKLPHTNNVVAFLELLLLLPPNQRVNGCGEQADKVGQELIGMRDAGEFEDRWSFVVEQDGPFHQRVRASSNNPSDPQLILDPWKDEVLVIKGSSQTTPTKPGS